MRAVMGWRTLVASEMSSNAFLCGCELEERVPEIRHQKPAQPAIALTPLRVDKIPAFLKSGGTQTLSRSIGAARVNGIPLGGTHHSPTIPKSCSSLTLCTVVHIMVVVDRRAMKAADNEL